MKRDITISEVTISILSILVGVCVAIIIAAWGANTETSIENTKLEEKILGLEKGLEFCVEDLNKCKAERQMYKFDYDVCHAQEIMINYLR